MKMYPELDLYSLYKKNFVSHTFSKRLPDVTKQHTLEQMNFAINLSDKWDHCMDIGGGTGHYTTALAGKFKKATLVEVDEHAEHAQLLKHFPNITIFNEYIEKYSVTDKVDFILLADLFEHIPDVEAFVMQLSSLQHVGGVVYIMTPNPVVCGPAPESGIFHTRHKNGHIKQYTTHEIQLLMDKAGYELILKLYEETPLRQALKRFVFAISRRDKRWERSLWYMLFQPIALTLLLPLFWIIEKLTVYSERKNRHNELVTLTQDLVFKKRNV